jgi:hypothetical protein
MRRFEVARYWAPLLAVELARARCWLQPMY